MDELIETVEVGEGGTPGSKGVIVTFRPGIGAEEKNDLRRRLIQIGGVAADTVDFAVNTSSYSNEILAHRIGLIPLPEETGAALELFCRGPAIVLASDVAVLRVKST